MTETSKEIPMGRREGSSREELLSVSVMMLRERHSLSKIDYAQVGELPWIAGRRMEGVEKAEMYAVGVEPTGKNITEGHLKRRTGEQNSTSHQPPMSREVK